MLFHLGDGQHNLHSMCQKYPESRKNESQAAGSHHRSWDATQRQFDLEKFGTKHAVTVWSQVCSGTGTGLGWSYLSNTVPLLTVLRCYRYCTPPNATPSPAARRLLPTDPNLNTNTSGGTAVAWETAMRCGHVTTTTSTSQQPHAHHNHHGSASSNSNRPSGSSNGSNTGDNDDGLGGIV